MAPPLNTRIVIGPNASMTPALAGWFLLAASLASFGISGLLACLGYWPVLPFAGLEVGALGAALWVALKRNRYCEVLSFDDDRLSIEFGMRGQGVRARIELPRTWTRVTLEKGMHRNSPTRLLLSCYGRNVPIAACLTDEERELLAIRLQSLLGSAWVRAQIKTVERPAAGL